jgi:electron transfer flavoprotein beta subunit
MRVLVCVKRVPAPGARINITADGQAIDTAFLGFTMSPHEECAVEEAVQLIERHGGESTVLTLGPGEADEQLRYAASLGVTKAVLLPIPAGEPSDWDPQRTAASIAAAIADLEASDGVFDIILFGNESADSGGFQVAIRVARSLARPVVNGIKGIEVVDAREGDGASGSVRARRETDAGVEVYSVAMPVVLGVKEGINLPRYPTLKGRLASKKVDVAQVVPQGRPGGQRMVTLLPAVEQLTATTILGHGPEAAPAVVDLLEELGLLR